ncbi:PREDICTED: uncharacterized protein LOC104702884 [Camelina sativa]|uniref:Uncharacterized protein LOC104702884 n=1 Tax=Camelina sativa TaxID=90675 RepID=A0ABM0SWF3_CAMSA|nr:PREDICTED: uncharacterized protein LOC104702884 [Camelina sativa]
MKVKQTRVTSLFLFTLVSILVFRPSEARLNPNQIICTKEQLSPIVNIPGCFDAVRLAAEADVRWLSRDCCRAVKILPDCLLVAFPRKVALHTSIFKSICVGKFPHEPIL